MYNLECCPNISQNTYMKPARLLPVLLLSVILLSACEGYRTAHGIVKDKASDQALDSVLCEVITGTMKKMTDSTGRFDVHNNMGGCMPDCRDIIVKLTKTGYHILEVTNPTDTIFYLQKQ
jgi:hypothetical protein